ncbi:hypothetical protein [Chryseobacterium sp.]|uniref:hypothetical protein n=1 Tax=Chryseobacterium sp. TaxID=1871047 RepID=UPI0025BF797F|nr:hypothetical protein [Chryseobacterium sp.]
MEIDLSIILKFFSTEKFVGGLAIVVPVFTVGTLLLYNIFRKIPIIKKGLQFLMLTFGLSIIIFIPFLFFSAFLPVENIKLILILIVICTGVSIYTLFNTQDTINFIKDFSKDTPTKK